ncbi:hypothetical protein PENTCL1PPCAC_29492, partial [Pristionchus entomophagus]
LFLLLSALFLAATALQCYSGHNVYGHHSRHRDLALKECPEPNDCCGVVWQWYGGEFDCFSMWNGECPRTMDKTGESCIGAWNGSGWDGPIEGPHWCACDGTVGHCMPDFPDAH